MKEATEGVVHALDVLDDAGGGTSMIATHEFVVPRSIPMTLPVMLLQAARYAVETLKNLKGSHCHLIDRVEAARGASAALFCGCKPLKWSVVDRSIDPSKQSHAPCAIHGGRRLEA